MLKSGLCGYSTSYILAKGTVTVANTAVAGAEPNNANKKGLFKDCALFPKSISRISNPQIDHVYDIDVVISMYNLIKNSDSYSKHLEFYDNNVEISLR